MEENDWIIDINYVTIKKLIDPTIERILHMIRTQLNKSYKSYETCPILFLIGVFNKFKYLQKRIEQEFQYRIDSISVPNNPEAVISRGTAIYGLSLIRNWKFLRLF